MRGSDLRDPLASEQSPAARRLRTATGVWPDADGVGDGPRGRPRGGDRIAMHSMGHGRGPAPKRCKNQLCVCCFGK
eukprot:3952107-Prymnesium_polylepis.1